MAYKKISELPAAATLDGSELVELVQSGSNVKATAQDIADLGGGGGTTIAWAQWIYNAGDPSFIGNGIITSIEQVIHNSSTDLEITFASGFANAAWCAVISVDFTGTQDGITQVHNISATKIWLEFGLGEGHWQPNTVNIHAIPVNSI